MGEMVMVGVRVVLVFVMMGGVVATRRRVGQASLEERRNQFIHRGVEGSGSDLDALLGEPIQGSVPDAMGDDEIDVVMAEPTGEQTGLMGRRGQSFRPEGAFGSGIDFYEHELAAAAEVSVQPSVNAGDRDSHEVWVCRGMVFSVLSAARNAGFAGAGRLRRGGGHGCSSAGACGLPGSAAARTQWVTGR